MGSFCEAFGITKIVAPSAACKKTLKRKAQPKFKRPLSQPKPFVKKEQPKLAPKKKPHPAKKKKPIVCYKCGKVGHKAFQCKTEQKINELFSGDPDIHKKRLVVLTNETDNKDGYYSKSSNDSEYETSLMLSLNVLSSKPQKEFLIDLIEQITDPETKREYLEKLKGIILKEEDKSPKFNFQTFASLSQIYNRYLISNPYQQVTTKQLQTEVNDLKSQVRILKSEVLELKPNDLEIEAKLAILESWKTNTMIVQTPEISGIQGSEIPDTQFLQTISKVTFQ